MSVTLDSALGSLLAQVDEDHHRVAAALLGVHGPAPADPELAALHAAILVNGPGVSLMELAETLPAAVQRQVNWATGAWDPTAQSDTPEPGTGLLTIDLDLSLV